MQNRFKAGWMRKMKKKNRKIDRVIRGHVSLDKLEVFFFLSHPPRKMINIVDPLNELHTIFIGTSINNNNFGFQFMIFTLLYYIAGVSSILYRKNQAIQNMNNFCNSAHTN